jgi:hypothetical protein
MFTLTSADLSFESPSPSSRFPSITEVRTISSLAPRFPLPSRRYSLQLHLNSRPKSLPLTSLSLLLPSARHRRYRRIFRLGTKSSMMSMRRTRTGTGTRTMMEKRMQKEQMAKRTKTKRKRKMRYEETRPGTKRMTRERDQATTRMGWLR